MENSVSRKRTFSTISDNNENNENPNKIQKKNEEFKLYTKEEIDTLYENKNLFFNKELCLFLNIFEDIPVKVEVIFTNIMNHILNQTNFLKDMNNIDELKNENDTYGLLLSKKSENEKKYKLFYLNQKILELIYKCKNPMISSHVEKKDDKYILNKYITIKYIRNLVINYIEENSLYLVEKTNVEKSFYTFFNINENEKFTTIEVYNKFFDYIQNNNLLSNGMIHLDKKLINLFNIKISISIPSYIFKKHIRNLIIPNNSCKTIYQYVENKSGTVNFYDIFYVLKDDKNIKNGVYRKYDKNNNLLFETYFVNNKESGIRRKWDSNGVLRTITTYKDDIKNGLQYILDSQSNLIASFQFIENKVIKCQINKLYD
jgi:hypothetical protein